MGRAEITQSGTSESDTRSIAAVCIVSVSPAGALSLFWWTTSGPSAGARRDPRKLQRRCSDNRLVWQLSKLAQSRNNGRNPWTSSPARASITSSRVYDNAKETCPIYPGHTNRLHHNFEDPAAVGEEERLAAFRRIRDKTRLRRPIVSAEPCACG